MSIVCKRLQRYVIASKGRGVITYCNVLRTIENCTQGITERCTEGAQGRATVRLQIAEAVRKLQSRS